MCVCALLFDWCCSQRTWIKLTDSFGDFHMADHLFVLSLVVFKFNCWKKSVFRYHIVLMLLSVLFISLFLLFFNFCSFHFPVVIVRLLYIVCCRRWLYEGSGNRFSVYWKWRYRTIFLIRHTNTNGFVLLKPYGIDFGWIFVRLKWFFVCDFGFMQINFDLQNIEKKHWWNHEMHSLFRQHTTTISVTANKLVKKMGYKTIVSIHLLCLILFCWFRLF